MLSREELKIAWKNHRGPIDDTSEPGFARRNTRHRRHCYDAGVLAAIEAQEVLLRQAEKLLAATDGAPEGPWELINPRAAPKGWAKEVKVFLQTIREYLGEEC